MQKAIAQGVTSGPLNPVLDVWLQTPTLATDGSSTVASLLADPYDLTWQVFSVNQAGQLTSVAGPIASNLVADKVGGVAGHFAATWAVPSSQAIGRYEIHWRYRFAAGAPYQQTVRAFDVLATVPAIGANGYLTVSDMREEGFSESSIATPRLLRLIGMASSYIDRVTGRFFEPRYATLTVSGTGGRQVMLGDPIIAIASVTLGNPSATVVGVESMRIFNRHLTERLTNPDDRDNPKVEFVHFADIYGRQRGASVDSPLFGVPYRDMFFPAGVQNINVTGLFGFTDWDGSCTGDTPELIRQAARLLVARDAAKLAACGDGGDRDDRKRYRLTGEAVRDQSYTLQPLTEGAFTGDREIDDLLLAFMKPMGIGAA